MLPDINDDANDLLGLTDEAAAFNDVFNRQLVASHTVFLFKGARKESIVILVPF